MKYLSEEKSTLEFLLTMSERDVVLTAHKHPIFARMVVRNPDLLAKVPLNSQPIFLCTIALREEMTARSIFCHLDVSRVLPSGTTPKTSLLQKIFRQHPSLDYKLEIIYHCHRNHPTACEELYEILLAENSVLLSKAFKQIIFNFFFLQYNNAHHERLQILQKMVTFFHNLIDSANSLDKNLLGLMLHHITTLRDIFETMSPFAKLPAPLIAKISKYGSEEVMSKFELPDLGWLKILLEDERVWEKVIDLDYPGTIHNGLSQRAFYSERRKIDKLYQFFHLSVNTEPLKEERQKAGEELIIRLKSLSNTGDQFCTLSYVKMISLFFSKQRQSDAELIAESDHCLKLLDTLIKQKYKVEECLELTNNILSSMSGLVVNEGGNLQLSSTKDRDEVDSSASITSRLSTTQ